MMAGQNNFTSLLMLLGLCLGGAVHADGLESYAHHAPIKVEGTGPFFHLYLPFEVYRGSLFSDLRDLRVFNAGGEVVPHALTVRTDIPPPRTEQTELRCFPLYSDGETENPGIQIRREQDGSLVSIKPASPTVTRRLTGVILDASRIEAPLVALDIALEQYPQPFQRFRIEAGDDLKSWHGVQDSATIAVLERDGTRIEQRRVELPGVRARYLRLTWLEPLEIPSLPKITATSSSMTPAGQQEMLWTEAMPPARNASGIYTYRLGGSLPVEQVRFLLPQANTLAPAQLLVRSNDRQPWHGVSSSVLYRLTTTGGELLSPDIVLGGMPTAELQLKLDARAGGVGAKPPQVKIAVMPQYLVFLARGAGPFTLAWGLASARASVLPLTTLVPDYRYQDGLPGSLARLDIASMNLDPQLAGNSSKSEIAPGLKRKWILWGLLVSGAILLLLMAWSLIRSGQKKQP